MKVKPDKSSEVPSGTPSERRSYFRINDDVIVKYSVIHSRGDGRNKVVDLHGRDGIDPVMGNAGLMLSRISQSDPDVAQYLSYLESRLNQMFRLLLAQELELSESRVMEASLSGGGLAFYAGEHLAPRTCLQIKLLLVSSCVAILTPARVIRSERRSRYLPTHPYRIAVEFDAIDEVDRDVLIKHILKRQAEKLRHAPPAGPP